MNRKQIHFTQSWVNAVNIKMKPNKKTQNILRKSDAEKLLVIKNVDHFVLYHFGCIN